MTKGVFSNSARHRIQALALGDGRQPAVRTEAETRAARPALVHANFSNPYGSLVRRMGRPPRTLSRAWRQVLPRRPGGTQPRNTPRQQLTVRQTDETDVNMPDTCNRCPESGGQPSQPVVSSTHRNPTTSSYNPPGEGHASRTPRPTCSRERGGATPGPVHPPHPPLREPDQQGAGQRARPNTRNPRPDR